MGYYSELSIDTRTCGQADDDAWLDRRDGIVAQSSTFEKSIRYDCITHDYRGELDGQLIGYFKTQHDAEVELNRVAYDWLTHSYDRLASELDAPIEVL